MTKVRPPVSIENTLRLVLGELTIDTAAALTGRSTSYLHKLTDPDEREVLAVRDLVTLDAAHQARFGRGFPLYATLGLLLETSGPYADAIVLQKHVVEIARDGGEACASLAEAALATARPGQLEGTLRSLEEADTAYRTAITDVRALIAREHDPPYAG